MPQQLTLQVNLRDDATFSNFFVDENNEVLPAVKALLEKNAEPYLFLWGRQAVGKSHLLQAACHEFSNQSCFYLPLRDRKLFTVEVLQDLENMDLVCIDDIQAVVGIAAWEEALFHFFNRAHEKRTKLMITADSQAQFLNCQLKDLQSRLALGVSYQIQGLDDASKKAALVMRANNRGIKLSKEVVTYCFNHHSRDLNSLFELLDRLDEVSLREKKRVTLSMLKRVIE